MNLPITIEIYAGGPGSGCQGPNCGRKRIGLDRFSLLKASEVFSNMDADTRYYLKKGYMKLVAVSMNILRGSPGGLQGLKDVNERTVVRRALAMQRGKTFGPISVEKHGTRYNVQDGIHRLAAFKKAFPEEEKIVALVTTPKGDEAFEDALYSVGGFG